mmetsp:Transcript_16092/g.38437  ORF Transcript_16092/g.38437 Transcript_16092/m.38437 type:complete len:210 (-) Transcript_16092:879-1508(-)
MHDLFDVVRAGDLEVLIQMLDVHGLKILDTRDESGILPLGLGCFRTAFLWAADRGHLDIMREIVSRYGLKILKQLSINGRTPLHMAAASGKTAAVGRLMAWDDSMIDARDIYGCTPFGWAATFDHVPCMKLMYVNKGKAAEFLTQQDFDGNTALHTAAHFNNTATVEQLLKWGGEQDLPLLRISNHEGKTPWDCALGHPRIRQLMRRYG